MNNYARVFAIIGYISGVLGFLALRRTTNFLRGKRRPDPGCVKSYGYAQSPADKPN